MYKTLILVVLVAVVRADEPEEPCLCSKDDASVWKFLQSLSVDVPEEEKGIYAVFPGELSPLAECDCENERRKRKVYPEDAKVDSPPEVSPAEDESPVDVDSPAEAESEDTDDEKVREKKSLKRGSCPDGRVMFGRVCVEVDSLDY